MIRLQQHNAPENLLDMLKPARRAFGTWTAASWESGEGPWNVFLPKLEGQHDSCLFNKGDGQVLHVTCDNTIVLGTRDIFDLRVTMNIALEHHFAGQHWRSGLVAGALILRPTAYIVIHPDRPGLYVPMPDASAHELLADPAQLEREYPGVFTIDEKP